MISYLQAVILAIVQGVTELFPISSLGHSVLISNLFNWHGLLKQETTAKSGLLTFVIALHVATAIALIIFYREEWVRIVRGFFRSLRTQKLAHDNDAKLAWLLVAATIPAGLMGLIFEHSFQSLFAKPFAAIIFLFLNGILLIKGDKLVRRSQIHRPRRRPGAAEAEVAETSKTIRTVGEHLSFTRAAFIGVAQVGALLAGISRSGITMVAGVRSGLDHEDAARFSFLLATPIILLAGLYKLPELFSSAGAGIRGQALVGAVFAGTAAYLTVRYLDKYFRTRSLRPFGIYCICFAIFMLLLGIYRGHF